MNKNLLDLRLLQVLVSLTESGNLTAAARTLGLSQPATSHALRQLREQLDDQVVVRVGHRMVPTPRGTKAAAKAREILQQLEEVTQPDEGFDPQTTKTQFVISVPEYVEHLLSPELISEVTREAPHSSIWVRPPDPRMAEKMLESGELDLRIGWVDDPSPTTRSRALFTDSFVCLVRKNHPVLRAQLSIETYAELQHVRAQVSATSTASRQMDSAMAAAGKKIQVGMLVPSYMSIARVVAKTNMIATVPRCIANHYPAELGLVELHSPVKIPPLKVAMYWHERMNHDPRHRWLRSRVVQAIQTSMVGKINPKQDELREYAPDKKST